jgi:hypothetical protein
LDGVSSPPHVLDEGRGIGSGYRQELLDVLPVDENASAREPRVIVKT